jgi:hypothetical protein
MERREERRLGMTAVLKKSWIRWTLDTPGSGIRRCLNLANHWMSTPAPSAICRYVKLLESSRAYVFSRRDLDFAMGAI